jgi:hypothetical protein
MFVETKYYGVCNLVSALRLMAECKHATKREVWMHGIDKSLFGGKSLQFIPVRGRSTLHKLRLVKQACSLTTPASI